MKNMKLITKAVITAILACGLSLSGLQAANAEFGGGTSGGGGNGSIQPPPNTAPPVSSGSTNTASAHYYEYFRGNNTWACGQPGNSDVIGSYAEYARIFVAGTYRDGVAVVPNASYTWSYLAFNDSSGNPMFSRLVVQSTGCIYKPSWVAALDGVCVKASTLSIDMTAPTSRNLLNRSNVTPWGAGDKSIAGCEASRSSSVSAGVTPQEFGHYHLTARTTVDLIWVKRYVSANSFGESQPDEFLGYAPGSDQGVVDLVGTQNCSGWIPNRLVDFSDYTSCITPGGSMQCKVGGPIAVDLHAPGEKSEQMRKFSGNSFEFMHDGEPRRIDFTGGAGAPTVAGSAVSNVRNAQTRYLYERLPWASRIWNNGQNYTEFKSNGSNLIDNYDIGSEKGSSYWKPGVHWDDASVRFYEAGSREGALITPEWNFTADFSTPGVKIDSADSSGNLYTSPTTFVKTGQANCKGNTLDAKILRPIGDSIR